MATVSTLSTTSQLSGPPVAPDVAAPGSEVAGAFQAILQPLLTTGSASASEQVATTVASLQVATQQAADPRLDAGPPAIPTMVPNNGPQDTQATGASSPASKSKTGHKPTAAVPEGDTETQDTSGCAATCVASAVASPPVPNPVTTLATAADLSGSRSAEETVAASTVASASQAPSAQPQLQGSDTPPAAQPSALAPEQRNATSLVSAQSASASNSAASASAVEAASDPSPAPAMPGANVVAGQSDRQQPALGPLLVPTMMAQIAPPNRSAARPTGPAIPVGGGESPAVTPQSQLTTTAYIGATTTGALAQPTMATTVVSASTAAHRGIDATPVRQLAPALLSMAQSAEGAQRITMRLHPADLGTVQIRIDRPADGTAHVAVTADNPETLQLLRSEQAELHRTLDHAGVPAEGRTLTFQTSPAPQPASDTGKGSFAGSGQGSGSGSGFAGRDPNGQTSSRRPTAVHLATDTAGTTAESRWQRVGLDISA